MEMMNRLTSWCSHRYVSVAARVLLSAIFVVVGVSKLMNFSGTAQFIGASGLPFPVVLTVLAIVFELGGGLMLLFGLKKRIALTMLIVFTVVVTALFHVKGLPADQTQLVMFLKNLAIIGGLLALYKGCGCGHQECSICNDGQGACAHCEVRG